MRCNKRGARSIERGFTITELLVIMGVIGVLMGLLLPVLGSIQRNTRATVCASNLRQIGMAHAVYMNFNNHRLVDAGMPHGGVADLKNSWLFALTRIDPALVDVLRSPVDNSRFWSGSDGGIRDAAWSLREAMDLLDSNANASLSPSQIARWSSYGLNDQLTQYAPAMPDGAGGFRTTNWRRLSRVPNPSRTVHFVMMTDGEFSATAESFAMSDHVHVLDWQSPHVPAPSRAASHMQIHAHGGGASSWAAVANYGFLDGHVGTHEFSVVYQSATENRFIPDIAR